MVSSVLAVVVWSPASRGMLLGIALGGWCFWLYLAAPLWKRRAIRVDAAERWWRRWLWWFQVGLVALVSLMLVWMSLKGVAHWYDV